MDVRALRHFLSVVDAGGFRQAEEKSHISQSALSKAVAAIEAEHGIKLFDRGRHGSQITPTGELLARRARILLAEIDKIGGDLRGLKEGTAGQVRVVASTVAFVDVLTRAVVSFAPSYPLVRLHLVEGTYRLALRALLDGEADFLIFPAPVDRLDSDLAWELLFESDVILVCRKGHPLSRQSAYAIEELRSYPWISTTSRGGATDILRRFFSENELGEPDSVIETNSLWANAGIVEQTDALYLAPRHLVEFGLKGRKITSLDPPGRLPAVQFGTFTRRGLPLSGAAERFLEAVRSAAGRA